MLHMPVKSLHRIWITKKMDSWGRTHLYFHVGLHTVEKSEKKIPACVSSDFSVVQSRRSFEIQNGKLHDHINRCLPRPCTPSATSWMFCELFYIFSINMLVFVFSRLLETTYTYDFTPPYHYIPTSVSLKQPLQTLFLKLFFFFMQGAC